MNESDGGHGAQVVSATEQVSYQRQGVMTLKREEPMPVQRSDWDRIRKNVARLGEPLTDNASTWAATAVGAAIGLLGTIVTLTKTDTSVEAGVIPSMWVAFAACVIFAICFGRLGLVSRQQHGVDVKSVCEDMDDVAKEVGHRPGEMPMRESRVRSFWLRISSTD
jgi:hypothetical protein